MENLTKTKAIELHREMWRRISEMSDEEIKKHSRSIHSIKRKLIKDMGYDPDEINSLCFLCQYCENENLTCANCPLIWRTKSGKCYTVRENEGLFSSIRNMLEFHGSFKNDEVRKIAKQISELPVRK